MGNPLATFLTSLVGGGQQQAPQAQAPAPAPSSGGGLSGFLGNPLVQGALAGYFSGISSPRTQGLGGAIGHGGLGALSAFDSATTAQAQQPYQQALTQEAQAKAQADLQKNQTFGNLSPTQQTTAQFPEVGKQAGILQANKQLGSQVIQMFPNNPKAVAYADSIKDDMAVPHSMDDAIKSINSEEQAPLDLKKKQSDIDKATADIAGTNATTANTKATTAKTTAETGLVGTKVENWYSPSTKTWRQGTTPKGDEVPESLAKGKSTFAKMPNGQYVRVEPDEPWPEGAVPVSGSGGGGGGSPSYKTFVDPSGTSHTINTKVDAPGKDWVPYSKPESASTTVGKDLAALKKVRTEFEASLNPAARLTYKPADLAKAAMAKGIDPVTGHPLPPLDAGWKYYFDEPTGTVMATDPDGTEHHWE